jgi:hypothetical protein
MDEINPTFKHESVQAQVEKAVARSAELHRNNMEILIGQRSFEVQVESPIEAIFWVWWLALKDVNYWTDVRLIEQHRMMLDGKSRRIDFVVLPEDPDILIEAEALGLRFPGVAIELDGHEFHERTKEQVAERNVYHYSGSELYRDPERCVTEVVEFAMQRFSEFAREVFYAKRAANGPAKDGDA